MRNNISLDFVNISASVISGRLFPSYKGPRRGNCVTMTHYTIIDFNEVDIRIYLPEKVIIHRGR